MVPYHTTMHPTRTQTHTSTHMNEDTRNRSLPFDVAVQLVCLGMACVHWLSTDSGHGLSWRLDCGMWAPSIVQVGVCLFVFLQVCIRICWRWFSGRGMFVHSCGCLQLPGSLCGLLDVWHASPAESKASKAPCNSTWSPHVFIRIPR